MLRSAVALVALAVVLATAVPSAAGSARQAPDVSVAATTPTATAEVEHDFRDASVEALRGRAQYAAAVAVLTKVEAYDWPRVRYWRDYTAPMAEAWPEDTLTLRRAVALTTHLRSNGNFGEAYRLAREAIALAHRTARADLLPAAYLEAGTSLSEFDPPAGLALLDSAVWWSRRRGDVATATTAYTHRAYALGLMTPFDDVAYKMNLDAACELACDNGMLDAQLTLNYHYVDYHANRGAYAEAEAFAKTSYAVAEALGGGVYLLMPRQMDAVIARARGDYPEALRLSELARVALERLQDREGLLELYPFLVDLYERTGDYRRAHELNTHYVGLRDSVLSLRKAQLVQDLEARYGAAQRQATIELQAAELRSSRLAQALLAAGLLAALALSVGVAWQTRRTRSANRALAALHERERAQNERLNVLMAELHHRVKNNLQTVSSLLRLQSRQATDASARAALDAGQRRVEVMAMIHQRLYESDDLDVVDVAQVIPELVDKIVFAYAGSALPGRHTYSFAVGVLEVGQAIPLCLIANELITNSCKHAHADPAQLRLAISLRRVGEELAFAYADGGPGAGAAAGVQSAAGVPGAANARTAPSATAGRPASGFGTKLIGALASQLNARVEAGAEFRMWFRGGSRT